MDPLVFLAILVVVAILALPIVAIVTANSRATQLRGEMAGLMSRISYLETRLENLAQRMAAPAQAPRPGEVQSAAASTIVSPPRGGEVAPVRLLCRRCLLLSRKLRRLPTTADVDGSWPGANSGYDCAAAFRVRPFRVL